MASPPPNPDTRELPYGWVQQYNWEYRQWFYVNVRENPPRSSWEHPLGPIPAGYAPPLGPPPPDRSYNRSPYSGPSPSDRGWNRPPYSGPQPPSSQGYGGYSGYQQPQGYYSNAPQGGYVSGPPYGGDRGYSSQPQVVYVEEEQRKQKRGPGIGTALLAGGAGLVGGALLTEAFESHNEREREEGFDQGYGAGLNDGQTDTFDF